MQENLLYYIIMFISNDSAVQSNNKCQAIDNCHVKSCFIFQNRKYCLYLSYQPNFWMTGSNGRVRVFQSLIVSAISSFSKIEMAKHQQTMKMKKKIYWCKWQSQDMVLHHHLCRKYIYSSELKRLFNSGLEASLELTT